MTCKLMSKIIIVQIKDLNKDFVEITRPYLLYVLRNKPSKSVTVRSGLAGPVHRFKRFSWSKNGHTFLSHIFPIFFKGFRADLMSTDQSIYDC